MKYERLHTAHKVEFQDYGSVQKEKRWELNAANDVRLNRSKTALPDLMNVAAAQNIHDVMVGKSDAVSAASAAVLLFQHLHQANFDVDLLVEDDQSTVSARAHDGGDPDDLFEQIELLLEDMVSMVRHLRSASFTIGGVRTVCDQGTYHVEVHLIS